MPPLKIEVLILHFQHSENTFGENFIFSKQHFLGAFCDKLHKHTNLIQHLLPT